jgi:ketosteroid isomerase-like protein
VPTVGTMDNPVAEGADLARRRLLAAAAMVSTFAVGVTIEAEPALENATELPPDLAKALKDYDRATIDNNIDVLASLVADDYMLVNSDATVQDKRSYLADFGLPGFKIDPYVMENPFLKVWGNTALTGGLLHLGWTQDGRHHARLLRVIHIWVKSRAYWQMTYTQLTRVRG